MTDEQKLDIFAHDVTQPPGGRLPQRIVCLTEETTETLYLLGEQARIVGISGFTVRPPEARREKPKVSAFTSAKIDKILALEPELVLGFSDLQADIAAELIKQGVAVWVFNQRSVAQILDMILQLGSLVGAAGKARDLITRLGDGLTRRAAAVAARQRRPRIYFEEWNDPLISGIRWVSELIQWAGGIDCFAQLSRFPDARRRILSEPDAVIEARPDIIIGSWCGKKFQPAKVAARPGWQTIPAVRNGQLHEIKSCDILQPGPAALSDGFAQLCDLIDAWYAAAEGG